MRVCACVCVCVCVLLIVKITTLTNYGYIESLLYFYYEGSALNHPQN